MEVCMRCPYIGEDKTCNVSLTMRKPAYEERQKYCHAEDYDACPSFLAHSLRTLASYGKTRNHMERR